MTIKSIAASLFCVALLSLSIQSKCGKLEKLKESESEPKSEPKSESELRVSSDSTVKIHGLTFVAPPEPFSQDPMPAVQAVQAAWIAVVPYAFTPKGKASVRYNVRGQQWWGERPEGVLETIRKAHEVGIRVMLKPQLYMHGAWTGDLSFATEAENISWEKDYETYILGFAALADSSGVELFCIGTEFRKHIAQRPIFWFGLIEKIRQVYHGKLTYSANWDDFSVVPFWGKLDFIGISAYFPLVNEKTPSVTALEKAWQPTLDSLAIFSKQQDKKILFTEYGYLSTDFCAWRTWEIEPKIMEMPINEQAQANALGALWTVCAKQNWWAGGFLWKWFPNGRGHEGYPERDYTPQGKIAEKVLMKL